ncbi:sunset domain-containing protein [Thiopseudomonas alkaliphila]|nr:Ada metal-binding domain-containing protein [Thiopseudomonas alkaliphila]
MVRGNRNSKVYHLSNCPSYDAMAERNRVLFNSESEAKSAGFRKAKNCPN